MPAQAAPNSEFYLTLVGDTALRRVCAGGSVVFEVMAERRLRAGAPVEESGSANRGPLRGMFIIGTVEVGYGTFEPAIAMTNWYSGSSTFTPLLPGGTTLPHRTKLRFAVSPDSPPPQPLRSVERFTTADFTAGVTTQLTLYDVPDPSSLWVSWRSSQSASITYLPAEYQAVGKTLTFASAIPVGASFVTVGYISQAEQAALQQPAWSAAVRANPYLRLDRIVEIVSCDAQDQPAVTSGAAPIAPPVVPPERPGAVVKSPAVRGISRITVKATSTWSIGMEVIARIEDAVMDADDQGHFTGSASVIWQTSVIGRAGCGAAENPVAPSRAALAGDIDASNQLVVRITFEPRDFSGIAACYVAAVRTSNVGTPSPLTITVPITGGTSTLPHPVTAKNGTFVGSATVVVTPEPK